MKYFIAAFLFISPAMACEMQPMFSPNGKIDAALVNLIDHAQKTIKIEAYGYTSKPILAAVDRAVLRGVQVNAVLDKSNTGHIFIYPSRIAPYKIQHNKVLIIDDAIMTTGSYNFTYSAEHSNSENLIIFKDCPVTKDYIDQFDRLWSVSR